jgi:hypothetical protein
MESGRLHSISLDHLTADQLNFVFSIAAYWDTRGWIYFLRGDNTNAQAYVEASWQLLPQPTIGDHLGQVYEKAGRKEDAIRTYSMAIASAERPSRRSVNLDDIADAKRRLAKLAGSDAQVSSLIERGRTDLARMNSFPIPNSVKADGSADFSLRLGPGQKLLQVRKLSGDASLEKFLEVVQAGPLPIRIPESASVEIPLRATVTCKSPESQCTLRVLNAEAASDLARGEAVDDQAATADTSAPDPHLYNNLALGMRVSLPDDWKLYNEDRGSFSRPHTVIFNKPGSAAYFALIREHMEGPDDLYRKMVEANSANYADFKSLGEKPITRDGLTGTRWNVSWKQGEVEIISIMEFFGVGDDHYRMTATAPKEVFDRYAESFENMMHSVQFPMLHSEPGVLDGLK